MNKRCGLTVVSIIIALLTMVALPYVPHHHHENSVCIGWKYCKNHEGHNHHDDCEHQEANHCSSGFIYIDSRQIHLEQDCPNIAILIFFIASYGNFDYASQILTFNKLAFQPPLNSSSDFIGEVRVTRGPPSSLL